MSKLLKSADASFRKRISRPSGRVGLELLSGKELKRPGAQLMNLILTVANLRGLSLEEAARQALGVSPSYFYALRNGGKEVSLLGEEHITAAARFLGMSRVSAKLAAGQLEQVDFYPEPEQVRQSLLPALQFIQCDPELGPFIPAGILDLDAKLQHFIIMLYERATGRTLIAGRVSPEEIVKRHCELPQGVDIDGDEHP